MATKDRGYQFSSLVGNYVFSSASINPINHMRGFHPDLIFFLQDFVTLQFCGRKLDKMDFFGKSDPFLAISRSNEDNR